MEEPETLEEALNDKKWTEATDSEYQSLMDNERWKLAKLPAGRKPIVTRFAKIDHVRAYCIMRNTNLKY